MQSSYTYRICPVWLRKNEFEVNVMSRSNCYSKEPHPNSKLQIEERERLYDELTDKIKRAGGVTEPIQIALNRSGFERDKIKDGHHRLNIAIELGYKEVPVVFVYE